MATWFFKAGATYTSGALGVFAASVLLILEGMERHGNSWQRLGATRHDAVLAIIRSTGGALVPVRKWHGKGGLRRWSPCTERRYGLRLEQALDAALGGKGGGVGAEPTYWTPLLDP